MPEYMIAKSLDNGKGGLRKALVFGDLLCDGVFGVRILKITGMYDLDHIPTGRRVAIFHTAADAKKCAQRLIKLPIAWTATTKKEWYAKKDQDLWAKAKAIISDCHGER